MNIRVALKKEMKKGGGEDIMEKEERVEEGGSGMLAMPIVPALGRETESVGQLFKDSLGYIVRSCLEIKEEGRGAETNHQGPL